MKKLLAGLALSSLVLGAVPALAADYVIDREGTHAFINFKIQHLGYSWLTGRFNDFEGEFSYDSENPEGSEITVNIDPSSVDTNHAERDKHLRGEDFLHVSEYPQAKFVSTSVTETDDGLEVVGDLTLHGVTKEITIDAEKVGEGKDPWGGYRAGFAGTTELRLKDFGIDYDLGPASQTVYLELHIEGIRQ